MIKPYLKLARSFNAGLTGIAPVLGALAAGESKLFHLFIFFLVGFFGHSYGFALNDIMDYRIDRLSSELGERPLVKKEISIRQAWAFTVAMLVLSTAFAFYLATLYSNYFSLFYLFISAICITIYDSISKKFPAMDVFVALGIFFLILYGASTVREKITALTWIVIALGSLQVLFMQFVAGGLKDAEHDYMGNARTLAIKMGVRVINKKMSVPSSFKILTYGLEIVYLIFLFYPFIFLPEFKEKYIQLFILILLSIAMFYISYRLVSMKTFERNTARKYIGLHYYINFSLVPIMLSCINPWVALLAFLPALTFILSNITLHGSLLPKTM